MLSRLKRRRRCVLRIATAIVAIVGAWILVTQLWQVDEVRGLVLADGVPLANAVVRVKATPFETLSDTGGQFTLSGFPSRFGVPVTAWVDGYYVGGAVVHPWDGPVHIRLDHYWREDNPDYAWVLPAVEDRSGWNSFMIDAGLTTAARIDFEKAFLPLSSRITLGCSDCHGGKIYNEWEGSAHAQGVSNVRFLTVYNGTDVTGNMSPATRFATHRDYGRFPLPPDPEQPYFGPGFKLDFPNQPGNCATCHAPTAALEREAGADINEISGIDGMGVHCDFCHKIIDVEVSSITGLPLKNMPGIQSIELRRPFDGRQLFFGPYDDVDIGPDTYLPLQGESRLCSSCHNASFWDTPIYESYREWLESPYPSEGQTCQSCHMKPDGKSANFAPGRGGMDRDPNQVFSHNFPGASDVEFLQDTAIMQLDARRNGGRIVVDVRVTNENAGHHIPTDHPMRNILLVVSAETIDGQALELAEGSLVPVWGGVGTEPDDYAGRPGKGFAKILEERWTGVAPAVAYWNPTVIKEDTRIPARNSDRSNYVFVESGLNPVEVTAELIFRRAFKDLADIKGWNDPDISMELAKVVLE